MVAGRNSTGHLLGYRGLDQHRAAGSRPGRPLRIGPQGYRPRQDADRGLRPRRHALRPTPSRKTAAAARWPRSKPCRACGWSTTKPASFPKPSRSSGRPSATSPGSRWAAVRRCRPARAGCSRRPAPLLAASKSSTRCNLSRGAPPRFDNAALLLLDQIGKLKEGKITISDTKVSLSGMARDLGGREAIAAALKNLPEGFSVAANDDQGAALHLPGLQGSGGGDADADRLCA